MTKDIFAIIRKAESGKTSYNSIGSSVNTHGVVYIGATAIADGKEVPRGIALGVFQGLPHVWQYLLRKYAPEYMRDNFIWVNELLETSKATSNALYYGIPEQEILDTFNSKYKGKIAQIISPEIQDKLQIKYLQEAFGGMDIDNLPDNTTYEWRDLVLYNHQGKLMGIDWWENTRNIKEVNLSPSNSHRMTAYKYLLQAGEDPMKAGTVTGKDIKEYFNNYYPGKRIPITESVMFDTTKVDVSSSSKAVQQLLAGETHPITESNNGTGEGGATVIGDWRLPIPPSNIHVYQQNQVYTLDALRMAGTAKLINNSPVVRVDLSFYINGIKNINDGLRRLVAQYQQTPFTVLRNTTAFRAIASEFNKNGITMEDSDPFSPIPVILENISISTAPMYPELLTVNVNLSVFNHMPYVKSLKFWKMSQKAVNAAIYSIYRNSGSFIQEEIDPDGKIQSRDRIGTRIDINYPDVNINRDATSDPTQSWAYRKTYQSLIVDANTGYIPNYPNQLETYKEQTILRLKYYSTSGLVLRQERFKELLAKLNAQINNISDITDIALLDEDALQNRRITIKYFSGIGDIIADVDATVNLYKDIYGQLIRVSNLYQDGTELGRIVGGDTYVKSLDGIGEKYVPDLLKELLEDWQKANSEKDTDTDQKINTTIGSIILHTLQYLTSNSAESRSLDSITPTQLVLGYVDKEEKDSDEMQYRYAPGVISSISASYRNKFTPVPVNGYTIPTYQHMGKGEWQVSLNLKTNDESIIRHLEDIQSSAGIINRDQIQKTRGLEKVTHRIEIQSTGNLLTTLGIHNVVMRGFNFTNIEGRPGWFNIDVDLVQDDVTLDAFGRLELVNTLKSSTLNDVANLLLPMSSNGTDKMSKYVEQLYTNFINKWKAMGMDVAGVLTGTYQYVPTLGNTGYAMSFQPLTEADRKYHDRQVAQADATNKMLDQYLGVIEETLAVDFCQRGVGVFKDMQELSAYGITTNAKDFETLTVYAQTLGYQSVPRLYVVAQRADGHEQTDITKFIEATILKPVNQSMYRALVAIAKTKQPAIIAYDILGTYERYRDLVADYFEDLGKMPLDLRKQAVLSILRSGELSHTGTALNLNMMSTLDTAFRHQRLSLVRSLIAGNAFAVLADNWGSDGDPDTKSSDVIVALKKALDSQVALQNEKIMDTYPDFNLPSVQVGIDKNNVLGPAFPYVDYRNDESLKKEYQISESFTERAMTYMAGLTGVMKAEDLKNEEDLFAEFFTDLKKNTLAKPQLFNQELVNDLIYHTTSKDVIEQLRSITELTEDKNKDQTIKLRTSRRDLMRLMKIQSIIRWYSLSRALTPDGKSMAFIDVKLKNADKADRSPRDIEVRLRTPGNNQGIAFDNEKDLRTYLGQFAIKDVDEDASRKTHKSHVEYWMNTMSSSENDQTLDFIYEVYTDMIRMCNMDRPEDFTNFLGFTDIGAAEERKKLRKQLVTAKSRNYDGSMYRAFPTVKVFFMKEDNPEWFLFDDFYNYNAILSVDIIDSKHAATQTAVIKLNNLTQKLSSNNSQTILNQFNTPFTNDSLMVKVGAPILIKGGYGPDHSTLPVLFTGAITQVMPGEVMEITAQSWGVELTNPVDTSREGMSYGSTSPERSMGAAILRILSGTKGLTHFGRWSPGMVDKHNISSLDIERAYWAGWIPKFDFVGKYLAKKSDSEAVGAFINSIGSALSDTKSGLIRWGNPLYDNIYLNTAMETETSFLRIAAGGLFNFFSENQTFSWHIFNQSVWDTLQEMALFLGDYIVRPLPYNEFSTNMGMSPRMTLYFGPRSGYYKAFDNYNMATSEHIHMDPEYIKLLLTEDIRQSGDLPDHYKPKVDLSAFVQYILDVRKDQLASTYDFRSNSAWAALYEKLSDEELTNTIWSLNQLTDQGIRIVGPKLIDILIESRNLIKIVSTTGGETASSTVSAGLDLEKLLRNPIEHIQDRVYFFRNNPRLFDKDWGVVMDSQYELPLKLVEYCQEQLKSSSYTTFNRRAYLLLAEYIYNYEDWMLADMATVIYDVSTSNYRQGLYSAPTLRERLQNDKLYAKAFDLSSKMGYKNDYLYRPVVEHHFINSYENIIDNQIIATADHMFNKVELMFPEEPTIKTAREQAGNGKLFRHTVQLNPYIESSYLRTYSSYQKNLGFNWMADYIRNKDYDTDKPYNARNAMPLYSNVANQILANVAKPMYQGQVTIIGKPDVRPWHIIHMYDDVNQMWGPFEVEQVVHSFNPQTGFTTTITPNAIIHNRDLSSTWSTQYMSALSSIDTLKGVAAASRDAFGTLAVGAIATSVSRWFTATKALAGLTDIVGKTAAGLIKGVAKGGAWATLLTMAGKALVSYKKEKYVGTVIRAGMMSSWMPLTIIPLMYKGKPYLAGVEGAYWGDDIFTFMIGQLKKAVQELDPTLITGLVNPASEFKIGED